MMNKFVHDNLTLERIIPPNLKYKSLRNCLRTDGKKAYAYVQLECVNYEGKEYKVVEVRPNASGYWINFIDCDENIDRKFYVSRDFKREEIRPILLRGL